jgi:hypothetical protein
VAQPAEVRAHTPHRSSWDCVACEKPWPCDPAREGLRADHDRVQLAIYMWNQLEASVRDLPPTPAAELFERFVKWTG